MRLLYICISICFASCFSLSSHNETLTRIQKRGILRRWRERNRGGVFFGIGPLGIGFGRREEPTESPPEPDNPSDNEVDNAGPVQDAILALKERWENERHEKSNLVGRVIFPNEPLSQSGRITNCQTPRGEAGRCRFINNCPVKHVIYDFDTFIRYSCVIRMRNKYVGICCPNNWSSESNSNYVKPGKATVVKTTTTTATPTSKPKPVQSGNSNGLNEKICGLATRTRIIGGKDAEKDWFWMAGLVRKSDSDVFCGGVLITRREVLTAAHCLRNLSPSDLIIRLGSYEKNDHSGTAFDVSNIKIHEKYERTTHLNDIAIITLSKPVTYSNKIKPICLPDAGQDFTGQKATVTGWGAIAYGGPSNNRLQEVTIPVWETRECDSAYTQKISSEFLCAGDKNGGKDSCQGDSGGPLMLRGSNERWMIIGVVSWGIRCGEPGLPGVYSRVTHYLNWIKANVKGN